MRLHVVYLLCLLLSIAHAGCGQLEGNPPLKVGASMGIGGVHWYAKPSIDLWYRRVTFRFAPGLAYLSGSVSWQFGPEFQMRNCKHRPYFVEVAAHQSWLFAHRYWSDGGSKDSRQLVMVLLGMHQKLNYRGSVYIDYAAGVARQTTHYKAAGSASQNTILPMVELRVGGLFSWPWLERKSGKQPKLPRF